MATSTLPVLLCFDGSTYAAGAIARAGRLLAGRSAVVLTVWEPVALWQPFDPATILTAPLSKLGSEALDLDQLARESAREKAEQGVELARQAGFDARPVVAEGKAWRTICDQAVELGVEVVVLGARGHSRVASALLGSVSSAVVVQSHRPVLVVHGGLDD